MKDKQWYMSRTVWGGLIIAAYGVLVAIGIDISAYKEAIISIATGLGIIGLRAALPTK